MTKKLAYPGSKSSITLNALYVYLELCTTLVSIAVPKSFYAMPNILFGHRIRISNSAKEMLRPQKRSLGKARFFEVHLS